MSLQRGGHTQHTHQRLLEALSAAALQEAVVELSRCPLIANPPALIIDSSSLTLMELGSRRYLASSDLPPACQVRQAGHPAACSSCLQGCSSFGIEPEQELTAER